MVQDKGGREDKGGRDSSSSSGSPGGRYVSQRQCTLSAPAFSSLDEGVIELGAWEGVERENMGVTGDQEAATGVGRSRGTAGGHQKGLAPTGGPKKITGARKHQLLEIPEEGGVSNSLTDDYIKSVPRLQVEWPMEGEEEEEGEGGGGRRKPRYQFEIRTGVNQRLIVLNLDN